MIKELARSLYDKSSIRFLSETVLLDNILFCAQKKLIATDSNHGFLDATPSSVSDKLLSCMII
jgi:hypothetical protein